MKSFPYFLISILCACQFATARNVNDNSLPFCFIENKGQFIDENNYNRNDIHFKLKTDAASVYIGSGTLHYQWWASDTAKHNTIINRADIELLGANKNILPVQEQQQQYFEQYFLPQCPNGLKANSCKKITYTNIYPNIDWVLYASDEGFTYDFIVRPGGDISQIKLQYKGTDSIWLQEDGTMNAIVPLGNIKEKAPYCYDPVTKNKINAHFTLNENTIGFNVAPHAGAVVIDPLTRFWTVTYHGYGGATGTTGSTVAADAQGNSYLAGYTDEPFSVSRYGSYQYLYGGGLADIYFAQFDKNGTMQWATYYGDTGIDMAYAATCDHSGNLLITGSTASFNNFSSGTGSFQSGNGGAPYLSMNPYDAFILKFSPAGNRMWATFYGGQQDEHGYAICTDAHDNVFIAGTTSSTNALVIASTGAFRTTPDGAFIARFTSSGNRSWGTYFSGTPYGISCDTAGNLYAAGITGSYNNISTTGSHQALHGGAALDGFLVKFDTSGSRVWGTYYGGASDDYVRAVSCDIYGHIYIVGHTLSSNSTSIATTGSFQSAYVPHYLPVPPPSPPIDQGDGFLVCFNTAGSRQWGTYYMVNEASAVLCDSAGHIWVLGDINYVPVSEFKYDGTRLNYLNNYGTSMAYGHSRLYIGNGPTGPAGTITQYDADTAMYFTQRFKDTLMCQGNAYSLNIGVIDDHRSSNVFSVQLSNASGSFASPLIIGTSISSLGGAINYTIPATVTPGAGYRIRVVASAPADTTPYDDGYNIRISAYPQIAASALTPLCAGSILHLINGGASPVTTSFVWTGPNGFNTPAPSGSYDQPNITFTDSGYYFLAADNYTCKAKDSVHVTIQPNPDTITLTSNSPVCEGDTLKVTASTNTPGVNWLWFKPSGYVPNGTADTTIPIAAPSDSGIYRAQAVLNGCPSVLDSIVVHINPVVVPTVQISASPGTSALAGDLITFTGTGTNAGNHPQWQWLRNSIYIPGATGLTYAATMAIEIHNGDTICLQLTSNAACAKPAIVKNCLASELIDLGVSTAGNTSNAYLYPNPNKGSFRINNFLSSQKEVDITVTDITGKIAYTGKAMLQNKTYLQFDLEHVLDNGIYLIKIANAITIPFEVRR